MYRDLDRKIIELLRKDARLSLREIALELDVSTTTISKHLKQLEENGVIRGYRPLVDYQKLGFQQTTIIKIKAKGNKIPQIVSELQSDPHLTHVYEITGEFDILVIGKFKDQEHMNQEIKKLLSHAAIEETNTSIVLSIAKEEADISIE